MSGIVDVVIVNWNAGNQLRECVDSLNLHAKEAVGRIVVVDNGSSDGSEKTVEGLPRVELIRLGGNHGFARGCNAGARLCDSPYFLFLNPDARIFEHTLDAALSFMDSPRAARVGICGVRLLDETGAVQRHCARFPSLQTYFGLATGLARLMPGTFPDVIMTECDHLSSRPVDHVIGAFYLVRRDLCLALGGFDERYFVYLEDLDFSLRASQLGWGVYYLSEAVAFHRGGGTSSRVKARRLFYSLRSRMVYGFRNFPRWQAWTLVVLTMLVEPWARLAYAVGRLSWEEAGDTIRGFAMLWCDLPSTIRKSARGG